MDPLKHCRPSGFPTPRLIMGLLAGLAALAWLTPGAALAKCAGAHHTDHRGAGQRRPG